MKNIKDFYNQKAGILCKTEEEWEIACELTKMSRYDKHPALGKFNPDISNNIMGIYKDQHGWINWEGDNTFKTILPLSDFISLQTYEIY